MDPVRLGIIGCGAIGPVHLQYGKQSPLIKFVAVADLLEERAREAAAKFEVGKVYADGDTLLDDPEVEAVVLAMPACNRTRLALRAFAKGKHVLTEKPVAMNAEEVRQMIAARGDLIVGCCSSRYRFLGSADVATAFVASGALGELRVVHCRALGAAGEPPASPPPAWRLNKSLNGGGILMNWGCYDLDYLLGVTGWSLKPKLVLAQTWTAPSQFHDRAAPGSDAETHYSAIIRCEGGTVIQLERGEFVSAQSDEAWQIIGSKGSLRLKMGAVKDKSLFHDDTSTEQGVVSKTLWQGDEDHATVHLGPISDFAAAIREHRQPRTSLEQALIVQKIADAIYASAEQVAAIAIE